jgi:archaellum biogenesis ATPase FlaH
MTEKLSTGVKMLDRGLNGGLPAGSVTALEAPPGSQGQLLLHELSTARGTMWMSFARSEQAVERSIADSPAPTGMDDPDVSLSVKYMSGETPVDDVFKFLAAVPQGSNIVLDPADVLEAESTPSDYRSFLNNLQSHLLDNDSLAVLYCTRGESNPDLRTTTKYFADVVFELDNHYTSSEVENTLRIPKYSRGECPSGVIGLELKTHVAVDTSRDIA